MYLYGASGHGKVVCEIAEALGLAIDGFVDDRSEQDQFLGYAVMGHLPHTAEALTISIGNNKVRKLIADKFGLLQFVTLVHPRATISPRSSIGAGTVVMPGVTLNSGVVVGKHVILNTNCSVDHDCIIEDHAHISPNAALAGNVTVGEGAHVGIGASVIQGVKIGKWSIVGAGAAVIRDVADFEIVAGVPAKKIGSDS